MSDDDLLEEQRAFYRARAPEYDDWWQRQGPYDRGEGDSREGRRQVARVDEALADELEGLLEAEGWHAALGATRWFIFGAAHPR